MKDANFTFTGFTRDAAKKSLTINRILTNVINCVESGLKLVTSTPKAKGTRMEISFSKCYENAAKYEHNFCITMDHDSGYISHNQESNSDCSVENVNETVSMSLPFKPIYLSEDALLEKPEVNVKFHNITPETEKEDCEDSKHVFNSSDIVIPGSVISERTTYSGFENDDSDSNTSIEIPKVNQIVVEMSDIGVLNCLDLNNDSHCNSNSHDVNIKNKDFECVHAEFILKSECTNRLDIVEDEKKKNALNNDSAVVDEAKADTNILSGEYHYVFPQSIFSKENGECCASLNNISNVNTGNVPLNNNEDKKKLTLIFTKDNKENVYSVKRKYRSITPDKSATPEEQSKILEKSLTPEKIVPPVKMVSSLQDYAECELLGRQVSDEGHVVEGTTDLEENLSPTKPALLKETPSIEKSMKVISQENVGVEKSLQRNSHSNFDNSLCLDNSVTPEKKYENPVDPNISPDLFLEEETLQKAMKEVMQPPNFTAEEKYIIKKDHRILRRAQNSLKGLFPPLSATVVQWSIDEMLNRLESNKDYFWTNSCPITTDDKKTVDNLNSSNESSIKEGSRSLLVTGTFSECVKEKFPDVLQERFHGLHFNRSKLSEEFEDVCAKYGQRYVGAETLSSCTVFETNFVSPTKRKQLKQRWAVKSPGRRLSHLARRRITFSSASLQAGVSSVAGSRARQILVDAKKLNLLNRRRSPRKSPRKTPKKTPSKSPRLKSRTPSSSAKKKLAMRFRELSGEIEKTVPSISNNLVMSAKRVVLSPDRDKKSSLFLPSTSGLSFQSDLKKPTTKRALFMSPSKKSPLKNSPYKRSPFKRLDLGVDKKRKRCESGDSPPPKLIRIKDIRPSVSEEMTKCNKVKTEMNMSLNKSQSGQTGELSAIHKKKLQWAVYEALRSQNITPAHAQFKLFASILARVTRRFLPNLTGNAPRPEGGTSDRMLRIARHHVYAVVKGKSVDEIISEYLKNRPRNVKPQGYVAIEEYERKTEMVTNKENIMRSRSNTLESLERKKLEHLNKPTVKNESRIDRIRKVINFGDDNR